MTQYSIFCIEGLNIKFQEREREREREESGRGRGRERERRVIGGCTDRKMKERGQEKSRK